MKTLNGVRRKDTPIIPPVNVRNIMRKSVSVRKTIITSNVTQRPGVSKTVITRQPVLFQTMLTSLAQVSQLYTKVVKETINGLVAIPDIQTHARPVRNFMPPAAVLMITISVPAAGLPAVRRIRL